MKSQQAELIKTLQSWTLSSVLNLLLRSDKAVQFLVKAWVAKAYTLYSGMQTQRTKKVTKLTCRRFQQDPHPCENDSYEFIVHQSINYQHSFSQRWFTPFCVHFGRWIITKVYLHLRFQPFEISSEVTCFLVHPFRLL